MRGRKASPSIGGTRAISFWRWPGTIKPGESNALTAHIDFFPTVAELAGAELTTEVKEQIEGRSLVPLVKDPNAEWADRMLFTHLGRWPRSADPNQFKFRNAAVRNTRGATFSAQGGRTPEWQLFDLTVDCGQQTDVAAQYPEVVRELAAHFDQWWAECLPFMVNEKALGPRLNPFAVWCWEQFCGGPTEADYQLMDPMRPWPPPPSSPSTEK